MLRRQYADDSLVVQVGLRIRALRNKHGSSLRDFGKLAGVHPFHVMQVELGQLAANTKTLRKIASALGVAPLDLLNHDHKDDAGAIVEMMRMQPGLVRDLKKRMKADEKPVARIAKEEHQPKPARLSPAQFTAMFNVIHGRPLHEGVNGASAHGGFDGTLFSLRRRKLFTIDNKPTEAGLAAFRHAESKQ
jgi:transcriptional regulator with XRE-family HTH domain